MLRRSPVTDVTQFYGAGACSVSLQPKPVEVLGGPINGLLDTLVADEGSLMGLFQDDAPLFSATTNCFLSFLGGNR